MGLKGRVANGVVRTLNVVAPPGWELFLLPKRGDGPGQLYAQDGLFTDAAHEFVDDPAFTRAYARGVQAAGWDYGIQWRVYVALWVANAATRVPGEFVECGVGRGMYSSAILESLPWSDLGRRFVLIDSFVPYRVVAQGDQVEGAGRDEHYADDVEAVTKNFAEWPRTEVVQGRIPEVLDTVDVGSVAYLHVDLNSAPPERAALEHFWPKLSPGAFVLLDDYGFGGDTHAQKVSADEFASSVDRSVLALPTHQGLIIR